MTTALQIINFDNYYGIIIYSEYHYISEYNTKIKFRRTGCEKKKKKPRDSRSTLYFIVI